MDMISGLRAQAAAGQPHGHDAPSSPQPAASDLAPIFRLDGRTAVVTGAASGIGRQSALTFAAAGARVIIADSNVTGLAETEGMLVAAGAAPTVVPTDVAERDAVNALAIAAIRATGRVDVWANVAGVIRSGLITEMTVEDVEFVTRVNLFGTYWGVAAAGRAMKHGGSIINVTSAGGDMPAPNLSVYAMTKAAVAHLTRCAATEFGPRQIRVNAVAPGFTDTPMVQRLWTEPDGTTNAEARSTMIGLRAAQSPLGTVGTADDQAWAMLYLATEASRFITGQILRPNGGVVMA